MERGNYLESLRSMTASMQPIIERCSPSKTVRNGSRTSISTQTNSGVWLDIKKPKNARKRQSNDSIEDVRNIKGTILVDGNNLISDGCGGYYMRVHLNDIRPIRSNKSNAQSGHHNYVQRSSNIGLDTRGPYYQSPPNQSNYRPNSTERFFPDQPNPGGRFFPDQPKPSGIFFPDQPKPSGRFFPDQPNPSGRFFQDQPRYRVDRRNADYKTRTFGQSFGHHRKSAKTADDDLFK